MPPGFGQSWLVPVGASGDVADRRSSAGTRRHGRPRRTVGDLARDAADCPRFLVDGTGAGTYETGDAGLSAIVARVRFNQAHNHYLQLASEGGVLLGVPVLLFLVAYGLRCREETGADASKHVLGQGRALCGLVGVA